MIRRSGVAAAVATIREATKVALVVAAIGLMCVGFSLVLRENPAEKVGLRVTVEYYAALLFFLAVSVTHNGVWGEHQNRMLVPRADWLRRSLKETSRAFGYAGRCASCGNKVRAGMRIGRVPEVGWCCSRCVL